MCGICGACALVGPLVAPPGAPERMIGALAHRGPDEFGAWRDGTVFLGHARLSIIDLSTGQQPLANEDGSVWITFNGEIFNYPDLRADLEGRGHRFRTRSDTETIVHAWEEWGEGCVERFNGQWAFAIWDTRRRCLFLARDRYGVRPLYWARHGDLLLFGSEIKTLLAWPGFRAPIDPAAVAEVFTTWVNVPPATPFTGVNQLPPGHTALLDLSRPAAAGDAALRPRRYWHPSFLPAAEDHRFVPRDERRRMAERVRAALVEAVTIRLRADVPVGAYLSGGLDSSATAALVRRYTQHYLRTFSVGFEDPAYDETVWQQEMARHLGTEHTAIRVGAAAIAGAFPDVVWHAETPLLRTAPSPLYALSGLVRREQYKVVLTGEGADEVFVGYDIHREAKVRAFWARRPADRRRSLLLTRLYPYLAQSPPDFLAGFYGVGLDGVDDDPFFPHRPRWNNGRRTLAFFRPEVLERLAAADPEGRLRATLPAEFAGWGPVARCQYLEMTTFLSGYLLSSQGDRMLMGHSVEGRFPFLDPDVGALAAALPASVKLESLREKSILKDSVADLLPADILRRPKQPYRAPDSAAFRDGGQAGLVGELLAPEALAAGGCWLPERVAALLRKWRAGPLTSARENMAFIGILSAQLLARQFGPELEGRLARAALAPERLAWRSTPAPTA
ncbi:MAG: asparagine synthase (glutamine-hydrolyzing) [Candidatus Krumholzibacteriia bacterium]